MTKSRSGKEQRQKSARRPHSSGPAGRTSGKTTSKSSTPASVSDKRSDESVLRTESDSAAPLKAASKSNQSASDSSSFPKPAGEEVSGQKAPAENSAAASNSPKKLELPPKNELPKEADRQTSLAASADTPPSACTPSLPPAAETALSSSHSASPEAYSVYWIQLEDIDQSNAFRLRPGGDVESLATSIVREGQLSPIDVRPMPGAPGKFQIIDGFRRIAALRLIMRRRVLAIVRNDLSDEDALSFAIAALLEKRGTDKAELEALKNRLAAEERLTPSADEALTAAISPETLELSPETIDCASSSPDPCALVDSVLAQFGPLNQALSQLAACWDVIPREVREVIMQQLGYSSEMARYFRRLPGGLF